MTSEIERLTRERDAAFSTNLTYAAYDAALKSAERLRAALERIRGATGGNGLPFANKWARSVAGETLSAASPSAVETSDSSYQRRVDAWMLECFGAEIAADATERCHRFLEEALELVQAGGCSRSGAEQLVEYVYGRPSGRMEQEAGGVLVTLATLCTCYSLSMERCGEAELARVWTKIEQIRAKQAGKPKHSPLPGPSVKASACLKEHEAVGKMPYIAPGADLQKLAEGIETIYRCMCGGMPRTQLMGGLVCYRCGTYRIDEHNPL